MSAVAPFSLLKPGSSRDELRAHAALLCNVKDWQVLDVYPCTALQTGLLSLTSKSSGAYVARRCFELQSTVDARRLFRAWEQTVLRNPILRTRIVSLPSHGLVQVVLDEPIRWDHAGSTLERCTNGAKIEDAMGLGTTLSRFRYVEEAHSGRRLLTWDIHHALYDGWSMDLLLSQVFDTYSDIESPALEPMTLLVQYLSTVDQNASRSYWRALLAGCSDSRFPQSRGAYSSKPNTELSVTIDSLDWTRRRFTPATVIKAAWSIVSARALGHDEALFGTTVVGRQLPIAGIERMAGPAIATVPARVPIDWKANADELLEKIQRQSVDVIPHEQLGLREISRVSESALLACDFHTLLVVQPAAVEKEDSGDFLREADDAIPESQGQGFSTHPLVLECQLEEQSLELRVAYDSSVLSEVEATYTVGYFQQVLRNLLQNQEDKTLQSLAEDSRPKEALERIWTWNEKVPETVSACMHELIRDQSCKEPSAPAICAWDGDLTYGQLEDLSTRLAGTISSKDVRGTPIPLFFEKSKWMPVAAVAVMKAGGAAVAIDTTQSAARLQAILTQTTPKIIVASRRQADVARKLAAPGTEVLVIDDSLGDATTNLELPTVDPTTALYIVFTSGSTGTPKGVIISHQNYASALAYQQQALGYKPASRVLDFASYAFDASWYNLLNTLTAGACLCIPSLDERQNRLAESFDKYGITLVDLTPSVARSLGPAVLSRLETLILGGEAVLPNDSSLAHGGTQIINVYGPAECTPTSALAVVKDASITIGRGAGACLWVVDPDDPQRLAPLGSVGELWVEGPIVGQGYLNNPEKTTYAFVRDPAWLIEGCGQVSGRQGLLYRTGDLVRQQFDGSLVFIGRQDHQVKINGQRVELGEIESRVQQGVEEKMAKDDKHKVQVAAEILKMGGSAPPILAAFVSLLAPEFSSQHEHDVEVRRLLNGLADWLNDFLPRYMVPAIFVPVQTPPFTPSGKMDRRKLHELGVSAWLQQSKIVATKDVEGPQNETEETLQQIWMSVLNLPVEQVSVAARFASLGGDSITAMQIVSQGRLRGIDLTVKDILEASTIQKIALRSKSGSSRPSKEDSANDICKEGEMFDLSPTQQMFFETYPDGLNHFNQSFILELKHKVSTQTLQGALGALVNRHAMLRARYKKQGEGGVWRQKIQESTSTSAFAFVEHLVTENEEVYQKSQWRAEHLDIENGPVFACDVFQFPDGRKAVALVAHHLVVDLVSWRIMWADLEEYIEDGNFRMQPSASFYSWSKRQAARSSQDSPLSVLSYAIPEPQFDFWGVEPDHNTFDSMNLSSQDFDVSFTSRLNRSCEHHFQCEPIDVIMGAIAWSFQRLFPERAIPTIWTEGHGREVTEDLPVDLSQTVGWFTTLCPIAIPLKSMDSVIHAVRMVKDMRRSVPGKGRPYYACRYHSRAGRQTFNVLNDNEVTFNMAGSFQQLETEDGLFQHFEGTEVTLVDIAPSAKRLTMIEINASIEENELTVSFSWHRDCRHQDKLFAWSDLFSETLESAVETLLREPPTLTIADLPLLNLSYSALDLLMNKQLPEIGISAADVKEAYPCLPLQQGILISQETGYASYATYTVFKVEPCDQQKSIVSASRLESAWASVVRRHSILSTIFAGHPEGGEFVQIVLDDPDIVVKHLNSGSASPVSVLDNQPRPTFLAAQPPHALMICQSAQGDVACRLDISHALMDGASMEILRQEIMDAYAETTALPDPGRFSDMVRYVVDAHKTDPISSWARLLDGVQPCVFQTFGESVSPNAAEKGGDITTKGVLLPGMSRSCKNMGISRSAFLHTAWALMLSHFTGMQDVCFGYLSSGRGSPVSGIEKMVGPIANLLISRIDLRKSSQEVLQATSADLVHHLGIQYASLAEIQHQLGASHRKLFNTSMSILDGADTSTTANENRSINLVTHDNEDPHEHELTVSIVVKWESVDIVTEYKEPQVTRQVAQEATELFIRAIKFLLESSSSEHVPVPEQQSLSDCFFKEVTRQDRAIASDFWTSQFENTTGAHFPSPRSGPQPSDDGRKSSIEMQELGLPAEDHSVLILMRAAWSILAARSLGTEEAIFGIADSDRPVPIPMRIALDWTNSVGYFLEQVETQSRQMSAFQPVSSQFIRRTSIAAAAACEFRTLLYECKDEGAMALHNVDTLNDIHASNRVPVAVCWQGQGRRVKLLVKSTIDLAESTQSARMIGQFEHVFDQLQNPRLRHKRLGEVSLVSQHDLDEIWNWNASVPEPTETCVHDLVAARVKTQPDAFAITAWDGTLTYKDLDALSTDLALKLVKSNVTEGCVVPLCFEKSMWMPVAALAVMKAGAASVCMDPSSQPEDRMRAITTKVGARVVLCSRALESLAQRLGADRAMVVASEQIREEARLVPESALLSPIGSTASLPKVSPSAPLYIIFTSGTTGEPKGIVIPHVAFSSAMAHQSSKIGFKATSRVLDFSPYAFDVVWSNLLNTLAAGACFCIPSAIEQNDIASCISKYNITYADFTPSFARAIEPKTVLASLETMTLGGEAMFPSDASLVPSGVQLNNAYGPAECTPTTTINVVNGSTEISIGKGVGVCTWLTEPENPNALAAIGAVGELWIEGPLVGTGYVNDPDTTARAFVKDPVWLAAGNGKAHPGRSGRLYRTGDLVRYSSDGSLIFVGRRDTQVKLRGQRVELGEAEHRLRQAILGSDDSHGVEVIADVIQPLGSDVKILAAFVEIKFQTKSADSEDYPQSVQKITKAAIEKLNAVLPPYMIPTAIFPIQRLPTLPSGKIDRRHLRNYGSGFSMHEITALDRSRDAWKEPQSEIEGLIRDLCAEVLRIESESISMNDSFFQLGGDSIGAMKLAGKANGKGTTLTVRDVFKNPVLRDLSALIESGPCAGAPLVSV